MGWPAARSQTQPSTSVSAGVLAGRGLLDPGSPVAAYVPEADRSGYAGATIRNLLDMRTGVAFREIYTAPGAEVRVMERSVGWRPARPGDPAGAYPYLATLGSAGPHGGEFTYRSADTDMLGWACERASGIRMGIHGQLVYVDRAARTVVVKMSSWPDAQHTAYLVDTLRACGAVAAHLAG